MTAAELPHLKDRGTCPKCHDFTSIIASLANWTK